MVGDEKRTISGTPPPIYKPIDSSNYEIRLLQIPFSMLRNLGQEDPKPLTGKLVHYTLPIGSGSMPKKFVSAVTRRAYMALSYVWGDPNLTNEIIIDGHPVKITYSLYSALRQLQSDAFGEEVVWVDAVCINQADDAEKSAQIRNMREVYHNAGSVRVWLGSAAGESDEIYRCMQLIQVLTNGFIPDKYKDSYEWWEANLLPLALRPVGLAAHTTLSGWHKINMFKEAFQGPEEQRKGQLQTLQSTEWKKFCKEYSDWRPRPKNLEKFLQLVPDGDLSAVAAMIEKYILIDPEWFSRIWVVQEVGVAWEDIDVCRGPYNMSWNSLLSVIFYLHFTCDIPIPSIEKVMGLEVIRQGFRQGKRRRLRELMYDCRYRIASDARDKIYGLFGLMGDVIDDFIKPDYAKSVEEVYTHATFHFITQSQSLDPICGQQVIGRRSGLPSWVPDYNLNFEHAAEPLIPFDGVHPIFHASGYDERSKYKLDDPELALIEWSILPVQGIKIGKIDILSALVGENETFGALQKDWQTTTRKWLKMMELEDEVALKSALDSITDTIDLYSSLYSSSIQHKSCGSNDKVFEDSLVAGGINLEKLPLSEKSQKHAFDNPEIDFSHPLIASYVNVLTTGRSSSQTRTPSPVLPPFPTSLPPPKSPRNHSESSLLPTRASSSTTNLLSNFPKVFGSKKSAMPPAQETSPPEYTDMPLSSIDGESGSFSTTTLQDVLETCSHLAASIRRKRFFITSEGSLGSGPETLREGDEVVVLFGCSVPVILRELDGGKGERKWEFVGEAFVDGFMDAEALAWLVRGRFKVEDFVLV